MWPSAFKDYPGWSDTPRCGSLETIMLIMSWTWGPYIVLHTVWNVTHWLSQSHISRHPHTGTITTNTGIVGTTTGSGCFNLSPIKQWFSLTPTTHHSVRSRTVSISHSNHSLPHTASYLKIQKTTQRLLTTDNDTNNKHLLITWRKSPLNESWSNDLQQLNLMLKICICTYNVFIMNIFFIKYSL